MGVLFSKHRRKRRLHKSGVQISDQDRAILDLKVAKDRLKRYQTKLGAESTRLTGQARELLAAGKKDRALLVLKVKRLREQENRKAENQLLNVETLIMQVEWDSEQLKVFEAMKSGNAALDAIHKVMSIEEVEKLMADSQDSIEYEQEVSRLLSSNLTASADADALQEYEQMLAESEAAKEGERPKKEEKGQATEQLPEVPDHVPIVEGDLPEAPSSIHQVSGTRAEAVHGDSGHATSEPPESDTGKRRQEAIAS